MKKGEIDLVKKKKNKEGINVILFTNVTNVNNVTHKTHRNFTQNRIFISALLYE